MITAIASGTRILIAVEDRGCGIPAAHREQVFEPFFTTKDTGKGTGLGLALVYSMVDELEGSIHFESPPGKAGYGGTRFSVNLPMG